MRYSCLYEYKLLILRLLNKKNTIMKTFNITFERQLFPWSEAYTTSRTASAKDLFDAMDMAEDIAERNTRIFKTQGNRESFVGKMTILSVTEINNK